MYVNNRPLNFNDPTGHVWEPPSRPIEIADISSWPLWAQVTTSVVVGFFGLVVDNGKIRTMNAAEGVDALATTPMTVSFPKIPTTGTSKANLINAAKELIKYGPESTEGKAAIKLLAETSTVNPNAKSVVIDSYPEYANYGARKGHTYFSMDPEVWKILDTPGKPWMPVNEQFVLNQQSKRFYVSFKGATFGDGLTLELKTLKELAKKPIFLKME